MMKNKKGIIGTGTFIVFGALLILFVLVVLHIALSKPVEDTYDKLTRNLTTEQLETPQKLKSLWYKYPIFAVITLFAAAAVFVARNRGQDPGSLTP